MPESRPPLPPRPPAPAAPLRKPARWLLQGLAVLSLLLGLIGAFLPVLPTVPFILLSAWAAARSSPRLLAWLENHTLFGSMLINWRRGGVVRRPSKWAATLAMGASAVFMLATASRWWIALLAIVCMAFVLLWLWLRPERFSDEASPPGA